MDKGDVVTVLTVAGEFIGKLTERKENSVVLDRPRMLVMNGEQMGFGYGICVTSERDVEEGEFYNVVLVTKTNQEIADSWRQAVTGIALA
jgi:hypothetical protein